MELKKIKIGIVGITGTAQITHLPILKEMKNVEIVAVCDQDSEHVDRIAGKFNIPKAYSNIADMLQFTDMDLVDVCTPVECHVRDAIAALENGKHVIVEKPFAENYEGARKIVDAANKYNRNVLAMQNLRYRQDAIILKNILSNKLLGEIRYVKSGWLRRNEKWRQRPANQNAGDEVLNQLGLQLIDLGLWLINNPRIRTVKASAFNVQKKGAIDSASIYVNLENDVTLTAEISWNMKFGRDFRYLNLVGENGIARLNPLTIYREENSKLVDITPSQHLSHGKSYQRSYENEFAHYVFCLLHNQKIDSDGNEIIQRFKLLDAIYQSVSTGKEVEVE